MTNTRYIVRIIGIPFRREGQGNSANLTEMEASQADGRANLHKRVLSAVSWAQMRANQQRIGEPATLGQIGTLQGGPKVRTRFAYLTNENRWERS
jgi:hypothetical protein